MPAVAWGSCLLQLGFENLDLGLGFLPEASLLLTQAGLFLLFFLCFLNATSVKVGGQHGYCTSRYGYGGTHYLEYPQPVPTRGASADGVVKQRDAEIDDDGQPDRHGMEHYEIYHSHQGSGKVYQGHRTMDAAPGRRVSVIRCHASQGVVTRGTAGSVGRCR